MSKPIEDNMFKCRNCGEMFNHEFSATEDISLCRWCSGEEEEEKEKLDKCEFYPMEDCICDAGFYISGSFICTREYSKTCQWANKQRNYEREQTNDN